MDGSPLAESHRDVASIAATGFGLTSLCIAADRNWISRSEAIERARNTLRFFDARAFQQRGWFYHWLDAKTGERRWNSEISSDRKSTRLNSSHSQISYAVFCLKKKKKKINDKLR